MKVAQDLISYSLEGSVAIVTIERPERMNALNVAALQQLERVLARAATDDAVRCLVITGSGGRAFSAGADVKEWAAKSDVPQVDDFGEGWVPLAHRLIARLYHLPKPVIAAVNGVAVGAGLDLALCCDFRFASEEARFGSVYVRVGVAPDAGGTFLLPRIVGMTKAKELVYTGRIISAAEAGSIGLVSRVVPADRLMDEALQFARELGTGPTVAIGIAKEHLQDHVSCDSIERALAGEHRGGQLCSATEDHREGLAAANERREAHFSGR